MPTHTFSVPEADRLDKILVIHLPEHSRARLQGLIEQGSVQVDGKTESKASAKLRGGEEICVTIPEAILAEPQAQAADLDIVYEDEHLIVINKAAGMVVHPAAGNPDHTLVNALLAHCGDKLSGIGGVKRPGIVHRLDKDTSGLIVAAKSDAAHQGLAAQFEDHSLSRRYEALVWGVPKNTHGTVSGVIGRSGGNRKKMAVVAETRFQPEMREENGVLYEVEVDEAARGKPAITHYQVTRAFGTLAAQLSCNLETGRTHQIRVHLSHIGHSVVGDPLYGRARGMRHLALDKLGDDDRKTLNNFPRQALHAAEITFFHPLTKARMNFSRPIPDDMIALIEILNRAAAK